MDKSSLRPGEAEALLPAFRKTVNAGEYRAAPDPLERLRVATRELPRLGEGGNAPERGAADGARLRAGSPGAFRPTKVNYAILGNQSPHIHWHLIPRRAGDPDWPQPVWSHPHPKQVPPPERAWELVRAIRDALR